MFVYRRIRSLCTLLVVQQIFIARNGFMDALLDEFFLQKLRRLFAKFGRVSLTSLRCLIFLANLSIGSKHVFEI